MEDPTLTTGNNYGEGPELLTMGALPYDPHTTAGFTDDQKLIKKLRKEALKKLLDNLKLDSKADSETISSVNKSEVGVKIAEKLDTLENVSSVAEASTGNERWAGIGTKSIILIDENEQPTDMVTLVEKSDGSGILTTPNSKRYKSEIARRKSPREKRTVRCYSPGRDGQSNQKKTKLGIKRGGKPTPQGSTKREKGFCRSNENVSLEGKRNASNARSIPKSDKKGEETKEDLGTTAFSSAFKARMTDEIKKQVLDGLGEVARAALQDVHVVEIEKIQQCMTAINTYSTGVADLEHPLTQRYVAKVKVMATVLIPLTVQVAQEPQELREQKELLRSEEPKESAEPQEPQDEVEEVSHGLPSKDCNDEAALFDVANFEYYDFDRDRIEDKFAEGQIWALYDDKDGLPRYYVQIRKILAKCPFEVQIAWLQPKALSVEAREWANSGNSLTCGEYDIGEQGTLIHVECFSHVMKPETVQEGKISVYPAKGDVWALYKGWNERANCEYEIVQVLASNKAASSVSVVPLVKAKGYRTLFIQGAFLQKPRRIPMQEITRFSHQIPVYKLDMEEVPDILKGCSDICLELDPAATPPMPD